MPIPPSPARTADGSVHTDVLIIGAGVAGLFAASRIAEEAPGTTIVVLDKGAAGRSGSSPWAQGGIAVAVAPDDSPSLHAADTHRAGDDLCDRRAVDVLTREGPERLQQFIALGASFDHAPDGQLHLAREGGQSVARSVHRADATGAEMVRTLREAAAPHVHRIEGVAHSLTRSESDRIDGCWVIADGEPVLVRAGGVLLATGGCGGLFAATTNQDRATADGVAIAWRHGASVRDLEFVQFHPTGLATDPSPWRLLLTEALRGAGATLHDELGDRFMPDVHPDAELAPRHVVTKAIIDRGGRAWLDATHLGEARLRAEFPTVVEGARRYGVDLATDRAPVTPAAHYQVGGVRTDLDGRTSLPGLWAAGEVASTGCHGANRMAGNSLLEALVFGGRAASDLIADLAPPSSDRRPPPSRGTTPAEDPAGLRLELRQAMWDGCGPVRTAESLARAASRIGDLSARLGLPSWRADHLELLHAVTAAALFIRSAALRDETRGGHVRDDHPGRDPRWDDAHVELLGGVEEA